MIHFYITFLAYAILLIFFLCTALGGRQFILYWKGNKTVEKAGHVVDLSIRGVALVFTILILWLKFFPMSEDIPTLLQNRYPWTEGIATQANRGVTTQHVTVHKQEFALPFYSMNVKTYIGRNVFLYYLPHSHIVMGINIPQTKSMK